MIEHMPGRFVSCLVIVFLVFAAQPALAQQPGEGSVSASLNVRSLQAGQQAVVAIVLDVGPGLHAQSHTPLASYLIPLSVKTDANSAVNFSQAIYPPGKIVRYQLLGKLSVYAGRVIVYVPIRVHSDAPPGNLKISGAITYQICNDRACFAPQHHPWEIQTKIVLAGQTIQPASSDLFKNFNPADLAKAATPTPSGVNFNVMGWRIGSRSYLPAFLAALVIGAIFNIMPCVLPIVPLKAMGFYQVAQEHRLRSMLLGTFFSTGIVAAFAVLAVLVIVLRWLDWGKLFSYPLFTIFIVAILVMLALQTFGLFAVILPQGIYRFTPSHQTFFGNFLFGIFTAILSTPCTFGMFLGLLIWAAAQPSIVGVAALMTAGVGMALPYWILGAFPAVARRLPRTGPWAELVKQMMGFLLLATAVYFARSLFPLGWQGVNFWWAVFAVVAASGLFLIVRTISLTRRPAGIITATVVALAIVAPALAITRQLTYVPIDWQPYTPARLQAALSANRPVVIDFTATWCGNCQALEATVFTDPKIVQAIRRRDVLALRADVTPADAPGWTLLRELNPVGAIPLTVVYLPDREPTQLAGLYSENDLLDVLNKL
jgi:thiol:disulfide interchange protein DsbD